MNRYVSKIIADFHPKSLTNCWPGFHPGPYALYNSRNAYIVNHPHFKNRGNYLRRIKAGDIFAGDTLILFDGLPTAIVNFDRYKNLNKLFAVLVHELFHGYQYMQGENRFPNELLGATYPVSAENFQLRNEERRHLYYAYMEQAKEKKQKHIHQFVSMREKRKAFIDDYLNYEKLIETIEGPALYVEAKAYADRRFLSIKEIAKEYGAILLDSNESSLNLRKSCYSSGMFLCLLLDELYNGWHENFMNSDLSLYDFFIKTIHVEPDSILHFDINQETEQLVSIVRDKKVKEFQTFLEKPGYKLIIRAPMQMIRLDPMNIIYLDHRFLHKNFIEIKIQDDIFHFEEPIITQFKNNPWKCEEIQIIRDQKPEIKNGFLQLTSNKKLKGTLKKKGDSFIFYPAPM
ncbi:hypothetical protein [Fervidibacillus albus]|uniref:Peptide ABC transporter permease n=1 Tax=Fervidibacillus albus TaxID=2980026 RepID=A0A9E8LV48_9BACI|nr:hypothetical protein [Fervidibacillus albus]WAA10041.1 hypothetical protein OE104_01450 [Fervidibacillus albus]